MIIIYLLMALLGSMATIFALQNSGTVDISFLSWSVKGMPVALVILLSLLLGIVFASLTGVMKILKLKYRVRQLEAQVSQLIAAQTPPPSGPRAPQGPSLPA
ncbi:MAG: lipopolysaccharide assembly protein LapA domain-containing protein [Actinomycetota bacterium]|jgi:uncharacterized integral membrane protein|nr:lipopolysaccharide assembly protein LapA domain-containing protein [Actinomycetota bacterium]